MQLSAGTREAIRESPKSRELLISERVKPKIKGGTVATATPERVGQAAASRPGIFEVGQAARRHPAHKVDFVSPDGGATPTATPVSCSWSAGPNLPSVAVRSVGVYFPAHF